MRYPSVAIDQVQRLRRALSAGEAADLEAAIKWVGTGEDLDVHPIETLEFEVRSSWEAVKENRSTAHLDAFEATVAIELHKTLNNLPLEVLDDPGFWRYLTVVHFWWLVEWRELNTFKSNDWSKIKVYVDGTRYSECVLLRMFLRGRIALEGSSTDSYDLATAVPEATDFWRSHIVRVQTGYFPHLAAAVITSQRDERMNTTVLREFARRLNRMNSNIVSAALDPDEARRLVEELRAEI